MRGERGARVIGVIAAVYSVNAQLTEWVAYGPFLIVIWLKLALLPSATAVAIAAPWRAAWPLIVGAVILCATQLTIAFHSLGFTSAFVQSYVSLAALALVMLPWLGQALRRLRRITWRRFGLVAALLIALVAFEARYLIEAKPIQFSDFMLSRAYAMQIAEILRNGGLVIVWRALAHSLPDEYSLLSALIPGAALTIAPISRALFQIALTIAYAAPSVLALGLWARRIAAVASPPERRGFAALATAVVFVCVAAPGAVTAVAFGMPDFGGVALFVLALQLSERLLGAVSLRGGAHRSAVGAVAVRAAVRLAAALFTLFLFRRWYLFAVAGAGAAFAVELLIVAAVGLRWRASIAAAGAGAATLIILAAPVALSWAADWKSHDYASIYAGYNYAVAELLRRFGEWYGLAIAALASGCVVGLFVRRLNNRPLRMTLVACIVAGALQVRVQSPSLQHFYLVLPLLTAPIGALAILLWRERPRAVALCGLALAAMTLTPIGPLIGAGALLPTASLPPAPRADLAELSRLYAWTQANATPDKRYCVLGSSEIVSGVLVDELWQAQPGGKPATKATNNAIILPQVDARDGPIGDDLARCAYLLVASPEQTSLPRDFMWVAALPARELLDGVGIGTKYKPTGDVFHLIHGVDLIAYTRAEPISHADVAALAERWRDAPRGPIARQAAARFLSVPIK